MQVDIALREIHRFVPVFAEISGLLAPAVALAREADHSVYDCLYAARRAGAGPRLRDARTLDAKLVKTFATMKAGTRVFELSDWLRRI